ncbi:type II toxin-antitoxin system YafQ family toxin [[Limnothrix rosea] IAM M-220]|uniref:type II toxin-antitoxin system YafQ family toxin n=1 Tax=[Limnothrix rosea] IAM M-220 TaxID=454133 RepID=UPI000963A0AC|nr:type II toxin-antitoxin system YafQ family toxin [[Limnothrix rosea] IAM M-220]OKH19738.1 hypothetical protein NIES208_01005 [[Limnothrix rosea] IAM M-220]
MYQPVYTKRFEKDVKRAKKRGKNLEKFKRIAHLLILGESLDDKYRDHKLIGNYQDRRECHIEPDWLLIYKLEGENIINSSLKRIGARLAIQVIFSTFQQQLF